MRNKPCMGATHISRKGCHQARSRRKCTRSSPLPLRSARSTCKPASRSSWIKSRYDCSKFRQTCSPSFWAYDHLWSVST